MNQPATRFQLTRVWKDARATAVDPKVIGDAVHLDVDLDLGNEFGGISDEIRSRLGSLTLLSLNIGFADDEYKLVIPTELDGEKHELVFVCPALSLSESEAADKLAASLKKRKKIKTLEVAIEEVVEFVSSDPDASPGWFEVDAEFHDTHFKVRVPRGDLKQSASHAVKEIAEKCRMIASLEEPDYESEY